MKITYDTDVSRPTLCYENTSVKRDEIDDNAKTYKLTPTGNRLATLIFSLVEPVSEIIFEKVGNVFVVDTGLGLKFSICEYIALDGIVSHLENLTPDAFRAMDISELQEYIQSRIAATQNEADMAW